MAEKSIVAELPYDLVANTLPHSSGYRFVPTHKGSVGGDAFFAGLAERNPGITAATARLIHETKYEVAAEMIARFQYRVVMPHETLELAVPGSTDSINGAPTEPAYVAVRLADDVRTAAADLKPTYVGKQDDGILFRLVEDVDSRETGRIVGTGNFYLAGTGLSASGDGEKVTVTAANGTEAQAEIVEESPLGSRITAHLAAAFPPGKGTITLLTRGMNTPEGELRPLVKLVTILAGETPPTPTGPTVTVINDGTFHAGGGNVVTGANMRFADAFPGNHLVIKDSEGTDMEAMISTDDSTPVTETSFALNIDEATPLTDGAEYVFEFEMLDADGEPVTVTQTARWTS